MYFVIPNPGSQSGAGSVRNPYATITSYRKVGILRSTQNDKKKAGMAW
jgi:hypothetical protein